MDQPLFKDYAHYIAAGEWGHVFPEGGIWQKEFLGGRMDGREKQIGKLKWGIGKLIAHAPVPPTVIVFYFSGMETVIPLDPITKKAHSYIPKPGHRVVVRFSEEISFDDLIEDHEKEFGKLWKYAANVNDPNDTNWASNTSERQLYSKITRRIESVLHRLNVESNESLK